MKKVILFANTDWFLYNFRLQTAIGLKQAGYDVVLVSPPGEYVSRLKAAGLRWIGFSVTRRGMNPIHEMMTILKLANLYRREKPLFVVHYTIKAVIYGSIAAKLAGVTHILNTITGLGYVFTRGKKIDLLRNLVENLYRITLTNTHIIFISQEDRQLFRNRHLVSGTNDVLIESCGVDAGKFSPPPDQMVGGKQPVVLFAGRLLRDKGIMEFAEMAKLIHHTQPDVKFAVVGRLDTGNPSALDCDLLKQWQRDGIVDYWGWQDDMVTIYHRATLVCLPSYQEGIPKTLLEAAACGLAIVATDVPGCREVVHHEVNGLLVPPRNPEALVAAVEHLLASPDEREEMGQRGRELVVERFSDQQVVQATLALMRTLDHPGKVEINR
ncbi:MAG: glycosyltransferase family 4 protein [Anaerolineae bacterium]|nr:glycosyltransferase family 4 protein [Anaerolineae bacterium]